MEAGRQQLLLCPYHGEGIRCTSKEEIHSAIGINGMSYALQIVQHLQRSTRTAELSDAKTVFWMDSQTVLAWIKTPHKRFKPFVSVRVAEIQETLDTQAFKYIRSDANPADLLTRGVPPEVKTWMEGPPFLQHPEEEWPTFKANSKSVDEESLKEIQSNKEKTTRWKEPTQCKVPLEESTNTRQPTDNPILQHLMKTCSTFTKARKTLAYVLRFINNARKKENNTSPTSPEELRESELQMFKWCQETINISTVDQKLMSKPDVTRIWKTRKHQVIAK